MKKNSSFVGLHCFLYAKEKESLICLSCHIK
jgi:hypothetical protein